MAVEVKQVRIGWRSRLRVKLLRSFFKFSEAPLARKDMVAFIRGHVSLCNESSNVTPLRA